MAGFSTDQYRNQYGGPQGGGGLVPASVGPSSLAAPDIQRINTGGADPGMFQQLLTLLSPGLRYAPGAAVAASQLQQGNYGQAIGAGVATAVAGRAMKNLPIGGVPGAALKLGGSLLAGGAGSLAGGAVSSIGGQLANGLGQLFGAGQQAARDVAGTIANVQRESGQAAGTGAQANVTSPQALAQQTELLRQLGVNIPNQYLNQNYQILQKYKDADVGRQMQLNQQNAMLTGQLNQQVITGQLAAGAQGQAGETTRQILGSNPYQASVLNTGNVRGI
jgi:hypothetical protein